jgi:hypothetical protein
MDFRRLALAALFAILPLTGLHAQQSNTLQCRTVMIDTACGPQRHSICLASDGRWYPGVALGASPRFRGPGYAPHYSYGGARAYGPPSQHRYAQRPPAPTESPAQTTELDRAVDKVVALDAHSWAWNNYDAGSAHDSQVFGSSGSEYSVFSRYTYNGGTPGWVKIRFNGNNLECLEFHDFSGCRPIGKSPGQAIALITAVVAVAVIASASSSSHNSSETSNNGNTSQNDRPKNHGPTPGETYNMNNSRCNGGDANACAAAGRNPPSSGSH